jgi:hypothetical protein
MCCRRFARQSGLRSPARSQTFTFAAKIRKEQTVSNNPKNTEQSQVFIQTPTQQNPGAAIPEDFKIEARDGGQKGDSAAERAALLAEADDSAKSSLREPTPVRNEVPHKRWI